MGYFQAGYLDITGVDIQAQPHYPFRFVREDALAYLAAHGHEYDVIHASPPCQAYSVTSRMPHARRDPPELVGPVRQLLRATGKPYVIENVPEAPLHHALVLCGTMFGLRLLRHRKFECQPILYWPPATCAHTLRYIRPGAAHDPARDYAQPVGNFKNVDYVKACMGIAWMSKKELSQAIPPAYTRWIGLQLREERAR